MEQPLGGEAAARAGVVESHRPLPAMNRAPSILLDPETCRSRMIQIERSGRCGRGMSVVSTLSEIPRARKPREEQRSKSAQLNTPRARHQRNQSTPWRSLQGAERHARSAAGAADAEYRNCSCGGAAREAQSRACKITPLASGAHGCLTPRSSGAPTAGHQARAGGTPYIFTGPGLASCRCRPLSSNVRLRKTGRAVRQQSQRLSA